MPRTASIRRSRWSGAAGTWKTARRAIKGKATAMRQETEYHLRLETDGDSQIPHAVGRRIFDLVWRYDFTSPGFCMLDMATDVSSLNLRARMVQLKERLSEIMVRSGGSPFVFRLMARFDQQETTKFHLDGGPDQSMLILGYEPSRIRSRLFLADFTHAAFDLGITPQELLRNFNPIYRQGEEKLASHTTEMPQPADSHARILLINNSSLPFSESRTNSLGVMHKAEIVNPMQSERRLVNSTMLVLDAADACGHEQEREFLTSDRISPKNY
jgi:hypothetical protein